jgi:hypothetical protein
MGENPSKENKGERARGSLELIPQINPFFRL